MSAINTKIPVISGPTAVGKTSISLAVARTLSTVTRPGSEIISADSRQVFRQMKIGTATPEENELDNVPHHFLADRNLDVPNSAGIFAKEAEQRIEAIFKRGHSPIVVGGSTLYLRALTDGLADIPAVDPEIRPRLNRRLREEGAEVLYDELCSVDPEYCATLDSSKSQRIIRGLEVWYGTGIPLSEFFNQQSTPAFSYTYFILDRDRTELYARINARVDGMIKDGLVEEVRSILSKGFDPKLNALQTIGYREVIRYLNGDWSADDMIFEIKKNSRRYAKRQLTWFHGLPEARWITVSDQTDEEIAEEVVKLMKLESL